MKDDPTPTALCNEHIWSKPGHGNLLAFASRGLAVDMWPSSIQWLTKGRLLSGETFWEGFCSLEKGAVEMRNLAPSCPPWTKLREDLMFGIGIVIHDAEGQKDWLDNN